MRSPTRLFLAAALMAPGACSDEPAGEPREPPPPAPAATAETPALEGHAFQRTFALLDAGGDSLRALVWGLTAGVRSGGVDRNARILALDGNAWETVVDEAWTDPPTAVPWRLLPHGGMRVLVGAGDAVETLLYGGETHQVELAPGGALTEWTGPRGGTYHLTQGAARVNDRSMEGVGLDVGRSTGPDEPAHGDWALLVSGDSLQVVLFNPLRDAPASGAWRGWARLDFRRLAWPVLTMTGTESRAYEPARRDVPVRWDLTSPREEVAGELEADGVWLQAREGDGPQLPVFGFFGVRGSLTLEGRSYPVVGVLHHSRG